METGRISFNCRPDGRMAHSFDDLRNAIPRAGQKANPD
jgi:hypothetical protein